MIEHSVFATHEYETKRLLQTGSKSVYVESSEGVCHLRQASQETSAINNIQYGQLWEMVAEEDADITESDRVVIDETEYEVKGVATEDFGSISYKKIQLVKKKV